MRIRIAFLTLASLSLLGLGDAFGQAKTKIKIGFVPSVLADLGPGQKKVVDEEFPILVRDFTGLDGTIENEKSVTDLADRVVSGATQFGVFQGIEFAEAQADHPELVPMVLSIYRTPQVKVIVVAKKETPMTSVADLKGKDVAILKEGKESINRYVNKEAAGDRTKFFGKITTPTSSEAALDAVLLGKVQAAIVDAASLDLYKEVNPGRFQRLKTIAESELFPSPVIAYNPKKVDAAVAKQFKDGMIGSNKTAKGRDVLGTFKITEFEPVPPGFEQQLAAIRKAYPQK